MVLLKLNKSTVSVFEWSLEVQGTDITIINYYNICKCRSIGFSVKKCKQNTRLLCEKNVYYSN